MKVLLSLILFIGINQIDIYSQIELLSDEFNKTCSLSDWQEINSTEGWNATHIDTIDIDRHEEGRLTIVPWTTAWYANYRSNLLYKEVSGDFVFTTHVYTQNRAETTDPIEPFSLSGAMIRTPKTLTDGATSWVAGQENYVFLALGYATTGHGSCSSCAAPHFEVKNTTNSNSSLNISSIDTAAATIRIAKIANAIIVLYQLPGGSYTIRQRYSRSDMPTNLQVGLVSYTNWNKVSTYTPIFHNSHTLNGNLSPDPSNNPGLSFNPDIAAKFDFARFQSFTIPDSLVGLNFADSAIVSDATILSLFDYTSVPTNGKSGWKIWKGYNNNWNDSQNWSDNAVPTTQDSVLIPSTNCSEVINPIIDNTTITIQSLIVELGGEISIVNNAVFNIDLIGSNAIFENHGVLNNSSTVNIVHSIGKSVTNIGTIDNESGGEMNIME